MRRARVASPSRAASEMYRSLGTGALELLWLAGASAARRDAAIREHVVLEPDVLEALAGGRVVLAASHTGNWEAAAFAAAARGRLAVVAKAMSVGAVDAFCTHLRRAGGVTRIAPRGALREASRVLREGGAVAMPIDQVPDDARHALFAPFQGERAACDRAPATLALRAGAALVVVAAHRDGPTYRVRLLARLVPPTSTSTSTSRAWIAAATREATAALDGFVREHPSAWLWMHRRWKPAPRSEPCRAARTRLLRPSTWST